MTYKKHNVFILLLLVFVSLEFSSCKVYKAFNNIVGLQKDYQFSEATGEPRLEYIEAIPIIHLYGTNREMGEQYGTILKSQLNSMATIAESLFSKKTLNKFYHQAEIVENNLPSEMKDFIEGMSESSGVSYIKLLALNITPRTNCSEIGRASCRERV